jgi:hypothetical protein
MRRILIGLVVLAVFAVAGFFGLQLYAQARAEREVAAAFAAIRAAGNSASHGKVGFDLLSRTLSVADVAVQSTAQPPTTVKLGRIEAIGVGLPAASRMSASQVTVSEADLAGTLAVQGGVRLAYKAPRIEIADYSGPAGALRPLRIGAPADLWRFALEHFAAVRATAITIPTVMAAVAPVAGAQAAASGEYTYANLVMRDIADGRIARMTVDKLNLRTTIDNLGKPEAFTGEIVDFTASDFDAGAVLAILDPAKAKDDTYYRAYRQMTSGRYTAAFENGLRVEIGGMTMDDLGFRPSRLQPADIMALLELTPAPGAPPSPVQMQRMIEKIAGLYEGMRIGSAEVRALTVDQPREGMVKLAAIRLGALENGKLGEFAFEGLDVRGPAETLKFDRFALKKLDVANLMRTLAEYAQPGRQPTPEQVVALLLLLEGAELKGLVAPYQGTDKSVNVEGADISWGQFVGPIPTQARVTAKLSGPVDMSDEPLFRMLAAAGHTAATISLDLGAAWSEASRTLALTPATLELGNVFAAAMQLSVRNVAREAFSVDPLKLMMAGAVVEAGPVELTVRDTGGLDLAAAQLARTQGVSPEAARRMMVDNVRQAAQPMAALHPDAIATAGAIARFVEAPRGTLTIRLTPRERVLLVPLIASLQQDPFGALARFRIDAAVGR